MKYLKFCIQNYKAIDRVELDVEKNSLIPIIGVNECGKTTILHAVFAFDFYNDGPNREARHLRDVENVYATKPAPATVSAHIELSRDEFQYAVQGVGKKNTDWEDNAQWKKYRRTRIQWPEHVIITRDVKTGSYDIDISAFDCSSLNNEIAREVINGLPYLLYFDDFQDSVADRVEIVAEKDASDWLGILEQLFRSANSSYSVYDLPGKEERQRKTMLSRVRGVLDKKLTREWQNFRLDESDSLRIQLDYIETGGEEGVEEEKRAFLKFDVVEEDADGHEHFFFIRDRSKGFYWFFNFVMKVEFNPKTAEDVGAIYLLDEPGSYLHALAQERLCKKLLQLSKQHGVIYCTHSHHLLNPEVIPLSSIQISEKSSEGKVSLTRIHRHRGKMTQKRTAYQPVLDALQVRPFSLEIGRDPVIIVEGIVDYYLLDMFKGNRAISILPSVGAESIQYYISLMIGWCITYRALWDNDVCGRKALDKARRHFGEQEAAANFACLPLANSRQKNRIVQDLVAGDDITMIKEEFELPKNTTFDKVIATLYYSSNRCDVLGSITPVTRKHFDELFDHVGMGRAARLSEE